MIVVRLTLKERLTLRQIITGYLICHYLARIYFIHNTEEDGNIPTHTCLRVSFVGNF